MGCKKIPSWIELYDTCTNNCFWIFPQPLSRPSLTTLSAPTNRHWPHYTSARQGVPFICGAHRAWAAPICSRQWLSPTKGSTLVHLLLRHSCCVLPKMTPHCPHCWPLTMLICSTRQPKVLCLVFIIVGAYYKAQSRHSSYSVTEPKPHCIWKSATICAHVWPGISFFTSNSYLMRHGHRPSKTVPRRVVYN